MSTREEWLSVLSGYEALATSLVALRDKLRTAEGPASAQAMVPETVKEVIARQCRAWFAINDA